jgi:hypothetical protein
MGFYYYMAFLGLSVNNRIAFIFRAGVLATCALLSFGIGHPPARAQRQPVIATERVVTEADKDQDIALSKLQEFQRNQESWNAQTGTQVAQAIHTGEENSRNISNINGAMAGGLGLISVFTFGAMIFQLKKKAG